MIAQERSRAQAHVWPALVDGRPSADGSVLIDVRDEGLLRGDGVYEVLRVYGRRPFTLAEHLARLERSCEHLRLQPDLEPLEHEIWHAIEASPEDTFDLRVVITRGGRRIVLAEPLRPVGEPLRLAAVTFSPTLVLDGAKSLSYAANMHATRLAKEKGCDEALLVTPASVVLEAPTSSFFWVGDDGRLRTPPLSEHILDSITRRILIELLGAIEQRCTLADALAAKEMFLASTTREVQAVKELDGIPMAAPGPVTRSAIEAFRAYVNDHAVVRRS